MAPSYFASSGLGSLQPKPRPIRVLVIDDEPDAVLSLVTLLRTEGFEAKGITDARSAIQEFDAFEADAVIADIAMPGMTGWDIAREVRQRRGRKPFLIAISGKYIKPPDEILARVTGFDRYLTKPCNPNLLFQILGAIIPTK